VQGEGAAAAQVSVGGWRGVGVRERGPVAQMNEGGEESAAQASSSVERGLDNRACKRGCGSVMVRGPFQPQIQTQ
jgi:hypothetical protein